MHPFTTRLKSAVRSFAVTASFLPVLTTAAVAEVEVTAIDFGQNPAASCGVGPVYSGEFDGTGGFVSMAISDCGVVESPTLDLGGGVTFQFTNVSGWNNTDGVGADQVQALTGDHFLTSALGADDPASFSVTGLAPEDILILEFVDRRGGEQALVTFEGLTTLVSSDALGEFTDVSAGGVTGATSYTGSFTGASGSGEGNLAGARITIVRPDAGAPCLGDFNGDSRVDGADFGSVLANWGKCKNCPQDLDGDNVVNGADLGAFLALWGDCPGGGGPSGACCIGDRCWELGAADCEALNGLYEGDGTSCAGVVCEPPTQGSCCEPGQVPGCIDSICANAVCLSLPECCDTLWDADCAAAAIDICNDCDGTTDYNVFALDFGQETGCASPAFTGTYDGSSRFIPFTISDCGAIENPSIDLGGVVLEFVNVTGWNNTDGFPANEVPALTGDHFFSAANGADDPVAFSISGLDPSSTLILEFLDRRGSETALVTFEGTTTLVDRESIGEFTDVSGGGVTGKSTYSGSFTGSAGVGEGNLAGARITVINDVGEGPTGACCLGSACAQYPQSLCDALGGDYEGDGTACDAEICIPPSQGICCEANPEVSGCIDPRCANAVCITLPDCCEVAWDQSCADFAVTECNGCDGSTDTVVAAIDFGQDPGPQCGTSPVFNGTFDATTGFVGMTLADCGAVESPILNVGNGVQLQFLNVTGWNNTDGVGPEAVQALTGDHFFSDATGEFGGDNPVNFQVTGMNCCDTLILEFIDRRGSETALVTFEGVTTLVSSDAEGRFTDVSEGGVTGKTTYLGSFTGPDGTGEGNLAGARLIVVPGSPDCDPSSCGSGGGGGDCGTCNQINATAGCSDQACQDAVCATDAFCCQVQWDSSCVGKATGGTFPECDC